MTYEINLNITVKIEIGQPRLTYFDGHKHTEARNCQKCGHQFWDEYPNNYAYCIPCQQRLERERQEAEYMLELASRERERLLADQRAQLQRAAERQEQLEDLDWKEDGF